MRGLLRSRWNFLAGWVAGVVLTGVLRALLRHGSASFAEKLLHDTPSLVATGVGGGLSIGLLTLFKKRKV
jgi:hypothetical protein